MILKKKLLERCSLYLILDAEVCPHARLWEVLKAGVNNGVDIVQLRDKLGTVQSTIDFTLRAMRFLKGRIPFIVNDRTDVAMVTGASGVHVGQDDLTVPEARRILGARPLVGRSCQNMRHLREAELSGADYAGFGSVFRTKTKPGRMPMELKLLGEVSRRAKIPVFAIGGITRENIGIVRACGVRRVAVCREILLAHDPAQAAKELKRMLSA